MEKTDKKEERLFQIKAVGLDTSNLNHPASIGSGEFGYIHLNFSSNNEEFTSELLENSSIFLTINFLDGVKDALVSYFSHNFMRKPECLLIDSNCDFEKYSDNIKELIDLGIIAESTIGISMPNSVEGLEAIEKSIRFDFISLNICPLSFNAEVVKWAKERDKKIVGFNPFGGSLSYANIINSFTVPYLLGFISTYADYVFLSSRDLIYSVEEKYYLESLIGEKSEKLYLFTKSLNKLVEPIEKAIKNYLIIDESTVIEVVNPIMNFGKDELIISTANVNVEEIPELELSEDDACDPKTTSPDIYVNTGYENLIKPAKPEDIDDKGYLSTLKYQVLDLLNTYNDINYGEYNGSSTVIFHKLCDNAVIITSSVRYTEKAGIFTVNKKVASYNFLLYYKDGKFLFRRIQYKDQGN